MTKLKLISLIIVLVFMSGCLLWLILKNDVQSFSNMGDFKIYEYPKGKSCLICENGHDFSVMSRQSMVEQYGKSDIPPITPTFSAKTAAYQGALALNQLYNNWTYDNHVLVCLNENANAWVVHGMFKDRNQIGGEIGLLVFDVETGEVLISTLAH
ncbi:MAG: hypothetical protein IJ518_03815 [Clostridia bacterium]|nr:hypothetical protein [Clostridia bacterium]